MKDYLPEPLSEEELAAAIDAAIAALGVTNMSGMGKVIQSVMGDYKGRVDGKAVSVAVKGAPEPSPRAGRRAERK